MSNWVHCARRDPRAISPGCSRRPLRVGDRTRPRDDRTRCVNDRTAVWRVGGRCVDRYGRPARGTVRLRHHENDDAREDDDCQAEQRERRKPRDAWPSLAFWPCLTASRPGVVCFGVRPVVESLTCRHGVVSLGAGPGIVIVCRGPRVVLLGRIRRVVILSREVVVIGRGRKASRPRVAVHELQRRLVRRMLVIGNSRLAAEATHLPPPCRRRLRAPEAGSKGVSIPRSRPPSADGKAPCDRRCNRSPASRGTPL